MTKPKVDDINKELDEQNDEFIGEERQEEGTNNASADLEDYTGREEIDPDKDGFVVTDLTKDEE